MTEPKRCFWQIHLSTAVVLMIAAGFILFLNCLEYDLEWNSNERTEPFIGRVWDVYKGCGWPMGVIEFPSTHTFDRQKFSDKTLSESPDRILYTGLVVTSTVWLSVLIAIGIGLEWFIRRRERSRA
jgi:hypothetical protein